MNAVPFDTLKLARRLEQAGMAAPVPEGTAAALGRRDMEVLRGDTTIRFGSMLVIAVGVMLTAMRYFPPHS
ncbi:MAG: hypothetical protein AB7F35_25200 [Acetobacteraceae bacterium]